MTRFLPNALAWAAWLHFGLRTLDDYALACITSRARGWRPEVA